MKRLYDSLRQCQKIFPSATCFQYDYLADDVAALGDSLPLGYVRKMPPKLVADLANPELKWIIFINPPFATANNVGDNTGKQSKDSVSMTPVRSLMNAENYEKAMVLYTVKKIPEKSWSNDKDMFYAPSAVREELLSLRGDSESRSFGEDSKKSASLQASKTPSSESSGTAVDAATALPSEFVADCVVWAAFSNKNNCAALKDVLYQGDVWQISNQMFPFLLEEVRRWPCAHGDIAAQLAAANEDRYLAKWIDAHRLSPEARAVMNAARSLYREFYANITHTPWMDWKIETWDVGYYQVRNAMKDFYDFASLREKHDALRAKLLPQIYSLGFLNPDVEYFA